MCPPRVKPSRVSYYFLSTSYFSVHGRRSVQRRPPLASAGRTRPTARSSLTHHLPLLPPLRAGVPVRRSHPLPHLTPSPSAAQLQTSRDEVVPIRHPKRPSGRAWYRPVPEPTSYYLRLYGPTSQGSWRRLSPRAGGAAARPTPWSPRVPTSARRQPEGPGRASRVKRGRDEPPAGDAYLAHSPSFVPTRATSGVSTRARRRRSPSPTP